MKFLLDLDVCYLLMRIKSLVQMRKTTFSDPDDIGKSLKPNIDSFTNVDLIICSRSM